MRGFVFENLEFRGKNWRTGSPVPMKINAAQVGGEGWVFSVFQGDRITNEWEYVTEFDDRSMEAKLFWLAKVRQKSGLLYIADENEEMLVTTWLNSLILGL